MAKNKPGRLHNLMRSVLYILFILFMAISYGITVAYLYWLLSLWLFDNGGFDLVYYIVILLPPFIYCWVEYQRFKRNQNKNDAAIYLIAGTIYLVVGLALLLMLTQVIETRKVGCVLVGLIGQCSHSFPFMILLHCLTE